MVSTIWEPCSDVTKYSGCCDSVFLLSFPHTIYYCDKNKPHRDSLDARKQFCQQNCFLRKLEYFGTELASMTDFKRRHFLTPWNLWANSLPMTSCAKSPDHDCTEDKDDKVIVDNTMWTYVDSCGFLSEQELSPDSYPGKSGNDEQLIVERRNSGVSVGGYMPIWVSRTRFQLLVFSLFLFRRSKMETTEEEDMIISVSHKTLELGGHMDIESLCHCLTEMKEIVLPHCKLLFSQNYSITK